MSDHTRLVARGLAAAGDGVRVYAPPSRGTMVPDDPGVAVCRLPGRFGPRSLLVLERLLAEHPRPDRVLVQYVPHAFGFKAMNLPFAKWIATRLKRTVPVWVVFHEVAFPFRWWPPAHAMIAAATRAMARLVAGAADRVFVTIPSWGELLKQFSPRAKPAEWLPVPCNVATDVETSAVTDMRERFAPRGGYLVGHFGTFGGHITDLLTPIVIELVRSVPDVTILLVGRGSCSYRAGVAGAYPKFAHRIHATGEVAATGVSAALRACDMAVQPYPDGISSRRTSAMAAIANGLPVVANLGVLSEPFWGDGALLVAPTPNPVLMATLASGLLADVCARATRSSSKRDCTADRFPSTEQSHDFGQ